MDIADGLFLVAGGFTLIMALLHELKGGPLVLPPLVDAELPDNIVGLHRFSWHVGTILAFGLAALFGLAVWHPAGSVFALVASLMSAAMGVLALALASFSNKTLWRTPAPYPWTIIAALGIAGAFVS